MKLATMISGKRMLPLVLALAGTFGATGCGGGGGGGGGSLSEESGPPPATAIQLVDLQEGDFWQFAWSTESISFAMGAGASTRSDAGVFSVLLGRPAQVEGKQLFQVQVRGQAGDFAPRWTHLGMDGDQLVGSQDGKVLETVFDVSGKDWTGGGFFTSWDTAEVRAQASRIDNSFAATEAVGASLRESEGGCTYYPSVGQTICSNDPEFSISTSEYYKEGVGPLGYSFVMTFSSDGGGFFTSFSDNFQVGLVDSSFEARDGWVANAPWGPGWGDGTRLTSNRSGFAVAAIDHTLFVFGGFESGETVDTVEAYDRNTDSWKTLAPLPFPRREACAEAFHGRIYVFGGFTEGDEDPAEVSIYDPVLDVWSVGKAFPPVDPPRPAIVGIPTCATVRNDSLPGGEGILVVTNQRGTVSLRYYQPDEDEWYESLDPNPPRLDAMGSLTTDGRDAFLVGGWKSGVQTRSVYRWESDSDTWSVVMQDPTISTATAAYLAGNIFQFGENTNNGARRDLVTVLDLDAEQLEEYPMPGPRDVGVRTATMPDGQIAVLGGGSRSVDFYDPARAVKN